MIDKYHKEGVTELKPFGSIFNTHLWKNLGPHLYSLLIDDEITVEVAGNPGGAAFHACASLKGKGLNEVLKA